MYRFFLFVFSFTFCAFSQAPQITQDSLKSLLAHGSPYDFLLIDVRGESELSSMIGNDVCKPYNLTWPTQLQAECGKIGKDQVVILYCRTGIRAQAAANYLDSLNFTHTYSAGGISTWNGPTVSKSNELPVDNLPKPSMKGTNTSITYKASACRSRTIAVKAFVPHNFLSLYVKKGSTLFNLTGREIIVK